MDLKTANQKLRSYVETHANIQQLTTGAMALFVVNGII